MALSPIISLFIMMCVLRKFYCISSLSAIRFQNKKKMSHKKHHHSKKNPAKWWNHKKEKWNFIHEIWKLFPWNCDFALLLLLSAIWFNKPKIQVKWDFISLFARKSLFSFVSRSKFRKQKGKWFHGKWKILWNEKNGSE